MNLKKIILYSNKKIRKCYTLVFKIQFYWNCFGRKLPIWKSKYKNGIIYLINFLYLILVGKTSLPNLFFLFSSYSL
jgi:hypothetical protein